jgi:hypothetical protein
MTVVQSPEELVAMREAIRTFIQREVAPKEAFYAQEITETGRPLRPAAVRGRDGHTTTRRDPPHR